MKQVLFFLLTVLTFCSCNDTGKVVSWSAADQQKFMGTCVQNAQNAGGDQQTATAHCNCTLAKIAAKYSSYDEANKKMTAQEVTAMEQECNANNNNAGNGGGVLGGNKNNNNNNNNMGGGWSAADEQKFMGTCVQNAQNAGLDQQGAKAHCDCTLKKIEAKYHSYDEANQKMTTQEVTAMEQECNANNTGMGNGDNGNNDNGDNNQ